MSYPDDLTRPYLPHEQARPSDMPDFEPPPGVPSLGGPTDVPEQPAVAPPTPSAPTYPAVAPAPVPVAQPVPMPSEPYGMATVLPSPSNPYGVAPATQPVPNNVYGALPPRPSVPAPSPAPVYPAPNQWAYSPATNGQRSVMGQVSLIAGLMPILAIVLIGLDQTDNIAVLMVLVWLASSIAAIATGAHAIRSASRGENVNRGMGRAGLLLGIFFIIVMVVIAVIGLNATGY